VVEVDIAAIEDVQRVEQLAAEKRRAAVGRTPLKPPKLDSAPQIATMIRGATPYCSPTRSISSRSRA
jgi:hypothetical protein